jgi:hypothetical protein
MKKVLAAIVVTMFVAVLSGCDDGGSSGGKTCPKDTHLGANGQCQADNGDSLK